jgi:hypothetical protein
MRCRPTLEEGEGGRHSSPTVQEVVAAGGRRGRLQGLSEIGLSTVQRQLWLGLSMCTRGSQKSTPPTWGLLEQAHA